MKNSLEGLYDLRKEETTMRIGNGTGLKSTITDTLKATVEQEDWMEQNKRTKALEPKIRIKLSVLNKSFRKHARLKV